MAKVPFELTADDRRAQAALERMSQRLSRMEQQQRRANESARKGSDDATASIDRQSVSLEGMLSSLGGIAASWASIETAISLARAEFENYRDVQRQAAEAQNQFANAELNLLRNTVSLSDKDLGSIQSAIPTIAKETGIMPDVIANQFSAAVSARGSASIGSTIDAVRRAGQIAPDSPEAATAISGTALDLQKATGTADARFNIGTLLATGQQARIEDLGLLAENVAPAVISSKLAGGGTAQEQAALFAALTSGSTDRTGRTSGTAQIALATQLSERFPDLTTTQAIRRLQSNEGERKEFLGSSSFQMKQGKIIEDLLSGGKVAGFFDESLKNLSEADPVATFERLRGRIRSSDTQQVAQLGRQLDVSGEVAAIKDKQAGIGGTLSERVFSKLQQSGVSALQQNMVGTAFNISTGLGIETEQEAFRRILRNRAEDIGSVESLAAGKEFFAKDVDSLLQGKFDRFEISKKGQANLQVVREALQIVNDFNAKASVQQEPNNGR